MSKRETLRFADFGGSIEFTSTDRGLRVDIWRRPGQEASFAYYLDEADVEDLLCYLEDYQARVLDG